MTSLSKIKNADNNGYGTCCKRFYFHGQHNYECRKLNNFEVDTPVDTFAKIEPYKEIK